MFSPQHQAIAAAGITVFAPNVRGSTGFGRVFAHADDGTGATGSTTFARADDLVQPGIADPGRIAVSGRSYGGYLTLAALALSRHFAAGIDICGMSDLLTFYRDTEPWIAEAAVTKYGHPEHDEALLEAISPLHGPRRSRCRCWWCTGSSTPTCRSARRTRSWPRCANRRAVDYLELAGEGHEYRRADSRLLLITTMVGLPDEDPSVGLALVDPAECSSDSRRLRRVRRTGSPLRRRS